jgi:CBS-domain-containing membrane protein
LLLRPTRAFSGFPEYPRNNPKRPALACRFASIRRPTMQVQEIVTPTVRIADPNMTIRDAAKSEGICYCFGDDDAEAAAQIMAKHQVRRLPVLNRDKRLVGVVALADLGRSEDEAARGALKHISQPTAKERR